MLAYDELQGSSGREVWYRAPRYDARKLFPHGPPRVELGSALHRLQDISLGGMAIVCGQNALDIPDVGGDRAGRHPAVRPHDFREQGAGLPAREHASGIEARLQPRQRVRRIRQAAGPQHSGSDQRPVVARRQAPTGSCPRTTVFCARTPLSCSAPTAICSTSMRSSPAISSAHSTSKAPTRPAKSQLIERWRSLWLTGNDLARDLAGDQDLLDAAETLHRDRADTGNVVWARSGTGAIRSRSVIPATSKS